MIDPADVTDYDRSEHDLQEFAIFCVLVAGKNATHIAKAQDAVLSDLRRACPHLEDPLPFRTVGEQDEASLAHHLRRNGIGCFTGKARSLMELAGAGLDLRTCKVSDLEAIHGIGPKTARFFVLHSRRNAQVAVLDTHVLRWLRRRRVKGVPKQTPASRAMYARLERSFLRIAKRAGVSPAQLDLDIWKEGSGA